MDKDIIIAVAETISSLKTNAEYYRALYEREQKDNEMLRNELECIAAEREVKAND